MYSNYHFSTRLFVTLALTISAPLIAKPSKGKAPSSTSAITAPLVSQLSYTAIDADEAADFCKDLFNAKEAVVEDSSLSYEQRWLTVGDNLQLRFETALNQEEIKRFYYRMIRYDAGMKVYTDWMSRHGTLRVNDLSPYIAKLLQADQPFLGPILKNEGTFHLVVRIPGAGYLTLESFNKPSTEYRKLILNWDNLLDASRNQVDDNVAKGKTHGGQGGFAFDDSDELVNSDDIEYISAEWNGFLTKIVVGYESGLTLEHGRGNQHTGVGRRFDLDEGELIEGVITCVGSIQRSKAIKSLRFVTSTGRNFELGTWKPEDDCFWMLMPKGHHLMGFHGSADKFIDQIGPIYAPSPSTALVPYFNY